MGLPTLPQTAEFSRVLGAVRRGPAREGRHVPAYDKVAITAPRRTSKTTSIWGELVGRCETQPGHSVITTAQTGKVTTAGVIQAVGKQAHITGDLSNHPYGWTNIHSRENRTATLRAMPIKTMAITPGASLPTCARSSAVFSDCPEGFGASR